MRLNLAVVWQYASLQDSAAIHDGLSQAENSITPEMSMGRNDLCTLLKPKCSTRFAPFNVRFLNQLGQ